MKLSEKTLQTLQNFATINPSICIKPGNVLKTLSGSEALMAVVKVDDTFDREVLLSDLPHFLRVLSLLEEPEFSFDDAKMVITSGKKKVDYVYSPKALVQIADEEPALDQLEIKFTLTSDYLKSVMKAASVLGCDQISIVGADGKLSVVAVNAKTKNDFCIEVGETDKKFTMVIKTDTLKMPPQDYEVQVSITDGVSKFVAGDSTYWVAVESESRIG